MLCVLISIVQGSCPHPQKQKLTRSIAIDHAVHSASPGKEDRQVGRIDGLTPSMLCNDHSLSTKENESWISVIGRH